MTELLFENPTCFAIHLPNDDVNRPLPPEAKKPARMGNASSKRLRAVTKWSSLAFESMNGNGGERGEAQARDVTQLLRAWSEGDQHALEKLTPLV